MSAALPERLRDALESAQAAVWDAHYGKGIATEYVQSVDAKIRAALAELAAQQPEPPAAGYMRILPPIQAAPFVIEDEPEPPAAGELRGEVAWLRQALRNVRESLRAIRGRIRRPGEEEAQEAMDAMLEVPLRIAEGALGPLLASAPAEPAGWEEVERRASSVGFGFDARGASKRLLNAARMQTDYVLAEIRPLWPPARLEAVREVAEWCMDEARDGYRRFNDSEDRADWGRARALHKVGEKLALLLPAKPPESLPAASEAQVSPEHEQEPATQPRPSEGSLGGDRG